MHRTTIELDDGLVEQAAKALGTTGIKPTIQAALSEVIRADARRRLIERLRDPDGYDDDALRAARTTWSRSASAR